VTGEELITPDLSGSENPVAFGRLAALSRARDATVPVENSRELHAVSEGSTYAEIDSGHVVVLERPGDLVERIRAFVR
jgi:pimeloyl-ACP methyl ester carboxylesterase